MKTPVRTLATLVVLLIGACLDSSSAWAQYGPPSWAGSTLRGRYHYYNGPHVNFGRGHWGGGISNNGALVLNTLTTTAGAVAPQIIPMFLPTTGGIGTGQSTPGPDGTVGTSLGESAPAPESLDVNREARSQKLDALEKRSLQLLAKLKLTDHTPLSTQGGNAATSVKTTDNTGQFTDGQLPNGN